MLRQHEKKKEETKKTNLAFLKAYRLFKENDKQVLATKIKEETLFEKVYRPAKENLFGKIYWLAKEKDKKGLAKIVKEGFCLGIFQGEYTPARLLAQEGDVEAVELLIGFGADLNDAVWGYAMGGYADKVENLISRGADLNDAVQGYATGGHEDKVENLLSRGASLNYAVQGYATGGHAGEVENLISRWANLNDAVRGYATGGHAGEVENLLSRGADLNFAVSGYARGGHADKVENLISRGASLDSAIWGYARGGYADKVENLLSRGASLKFAVWGYATGGHADKVENLLSRGASLNYAVQGYALGGHADKVENLLSRGASLNDAVLGYAMGGYFKNHDMALRILTFTKNIEIRKKLAEAAKKENASLSPEILLREAAKLNQLRNENRMDFNQALSFMKPWMMPELHIWFLYGIHLAKENGLPLEMFIHISSFIVGLSNKDTINLFNKYLEVMPKKLFDFSIRKAKEKFNSYSNFTKEAYEQTKTEANDRYQKRLTF